MIIKPFYIIAFVVLSLTGKNKSTELPQYLQVQTTYDLRSDESITHYLPQRLKNLTTQVKNIGIEATAQSLIKDSDFDSYLFIIEAESPNRLIAYSRHPEWYQKTPAELQKIFFPTNKTTISIAQSASLIVSSAHRSTSYVPYQWAPSKVGNGQQIAYVALVTIDKKIYVLGATLYVTRQYEHIILPYNVNALIKRIEKDGLETVIDLINNYNPSPERYFYIVRAKYPYRYIAYGNTPRLMNMTPKERREQDPNGNVEGHDFVKHVTDLIDIAKRGGGFYAYIWHKQGEKENRLRIVYVKMFSYQKKKYVMATGYIPSITPNEVAQIQKNIDRAYTLLKEIGLGNTISTLKKTNADSSYVYIVNATPPTTYLLHQNPQFNHHTIPEVQTYLNSYGARQVDLSAITKTSAQLAQHGGGWNAFQFIVNPQKPELGFTLKTSLIKPFYYNNQLYYFGAGIGLDQA